MGRLVGMEKKMETSILGTFKGIVRDICGFPKIRGTFLGSL